jgi:hypothetical protein
MTMEIVSRFFDVDPTKEELNFSESAAKDMLDKLGSELKSKYK